MPRNSVVLLGGDNLSTRIVYHALREEFPVLSVILERPGSRLQMLLKRRRRLGSLKVLGQAAFAVAVVPCLSLAAKARVEDIKKASRLSESPIAQAVAYVDTVNSGECRSQLRNHAPAVVVVNGTRIISPDTLNSVDAPFINMHAGITPLYRGVHGGYWALVDGRPDLVGTTVHLVDAGIDTGGVIAQPAFEITARDSFVTYPYLHLAAGIPRLKDAVHQALRGELQGVSNPRGLASQLRYHPTAFGYLYNRIVRGIR